MCIWFVVFPKAKRIGFYEDIEGEDSPNVVQELSKLTQNPYWGNHFGSRGYFVSTVGVDEDRVKRYVKYQDEERKEDGTTDLRLF